MLRKISAILATHAFVLSWAIDSERPIGSACANQGHAHLQRCSSVSANPLLARGELSYHSTLMRSWPLTSAAHDGGLESSEAQQVGLSRSDMDMQLQSLQRIPDTFTQTEAAALSPRLLT